MGEKLIIKGWPQISPKEQLMSGYSRKIRMKIKYETQIVDQANLSFRQTTNNPVAPNTQGKLVP